MKKVLVCIAFTVLILFSACSKQSSVKNKINTDSCVSNSDSLQKQSETAENGEDFEISATGDAEISTNENYTEKNKNSNKSQTQKSPDTQVDITAVEAPKSNYVSLTINCLNAVAYGIRSNEAYEKIIPENGVMLSNDNIEIYDGETVLKVLKRVLKENKIACQVTSGGYVRSLGGLSEFDCGSGSGWLYMVNGIKPNVSSKNYVLSPGDKIEFIYTCINGDV